MSEETGSGEDRVRDAARGGKRVKAARPKPIPVDPPDGPINALGLPLGCPVTPLGLMGDMRFYLDAARQLRPLATGDHTRNRLLGLFINQPDFIYNIRRWTRRNPEGVVTGIRPELIAEDLMSSCGNAGIYDPRERERGRGAWQGEDGELILHNGDCIQVFARHEPWQSRQHHKPGVFSAHVYPAGEPVARPATSDPEANADDPVDVLLELLDTWNWRRQDLDSVLLLGWLAAAMIGGALEWRPALWLTGGKGTGKSTLQAMIKHVLGDNVLALANATGASIWQTLKHQSLPVALDELEAGEDNRRAQSVIDLARLAASGGKMARGTDRHEAVEFTLRSCFLFSSVLVPPLAGPDRSRLAILELDELPATPTPLKLRAADLRMIGRHMRRRLVIGWQRFEETLDYYRTKLASQGGGHSKRGADQFGTLLACADLVLWPDGTDHAVAQDWLDRMGAAFMNEVTDDMRDEEQCLQHLLATQIDPYRSGEKASLGEWINRALGRVRGFDDAGGAQKVIQKYGVRIERGTAAYPGGTVSNWVAVANSHSTLSGIYERTRWGSPRGVSGVWTQALRRLPGAQRADKTLYFGGPTAKATLLSLETIPRPDEHGHVAVTGA